MCTDFYRQIAGVAVAAKSVVPPSMSRCTFTPPLPVSYPYTPHDQGLYGAHQTDMCLLHQTDMCLVHHQCPLTFECASSLTCLGCDLE